MQEQDRTAVLSGAEVGLRSLWLSVFQGVSLEDFLLAPVRGQSEENPLRSMCTPPGQQLSTAYDSEIHSFSHWVIITNLHHCWQLFCYGETELLFTFISTSFVPLGPLFQSQTDIRWSLCSSTAQTWAPSGEKETQATALQTNSSV